MMLLHILSYIKPLKKVKVVLGNKTLKYGTDYTISYKNNKNVFRVTNVLICGDIDKYI